MNLVLIGLRGSGKTTLGRSLGQRSGRAFIDLDEKTPEVLGAATVREAWDRHGAAEFRRAEVVALKRALAADSQIIALGGGTPTAPGAADLLRQEQKIGRITIVYLASDASTLRARLIAADNTDRPSLTGADPLAEIGAVLAARDPLFRDLADEVMQTDELSTDEALGELTRLVTP
jgi:shikimate kinase